MRIGSAAILDGVDYTRWNPASDRLLPARYDARRLGGKEVCREALLKQMNLAPGPRGPVFGMVTRVVQEKVSKSSCRSSIAYFGTMFA